MMLKTTWMMRGGDSVSQEYLSECGMRPNAERKEAELGQVTSLSVEWT